MDVMRAIFIWAQAKGLIFLKCIKKHRVSIHVVIFGFTLIYEFGDSNLWWDNIRGRSSVLNALEAITLNGTHSLDEQHNPNEFKALRKIIESNTKNLLIHNGFYLYDLNNNSITRNSTLAYVIYFKPISIKIAPPFEITSTGLGKNYVLDYTPVEFEYAYPSTKKDQNGEYFELISTSTKTIYVGSIGDVKSWIVDSRNKDRIVFLTMFISGISLLSALSESYKNDN
jgi:hypothetical protein